jgi:8-oxo-dGTP diphosphatase
MPKTDQGAVPGRYVVIPRTLIFVSHLESVLLILGSARKRLWANRYNGIGGHIERGEDALSAAQRELFEETGLTAVSLRLVGTVLVDVEKDMGIALYVYHGYSEKIDTVPSPEGTLAWVPVSELANRPLVEDLHTLLPRVLKMKPEDSPFSARYFYEGEALKIVFSDSDECS